MRLELNHRARGQIDRIGAGGEVIVSIGVYEFKTNLSDFECVLDDLQHDLMVLRSGGQVAS